MAESRSGRVGFLHFAFCILIFDMLLGTFVQESGQVPPGHAPPHLGASPQESQAGVAAALPTAKPESSFVKPELPHFSQVGGWALRLF